MGFTPQLVDLNGDGGMDVISGSWPGQLCFFRRESDGSFAKREHLVDKDGKEINLGSASTVFAVDWDADADLDLLVASDFRSSKSRSSAIQFCHCIPQHRYPELC